MLDVGIQLQPKIVQRIRRIVGVGDDFATNDSLSGIIQFNIDLIINLLLPVAVSGSA